MRFIADHMLGRLARWLRVLGYDTTYPGEVGDNELIRLSYAERRILLTRDRELAKRKVGGVLLIESEHIANQLAQVINHLSLDVSKKIFTRCLKCNRPLVRVAKSKVKDYVPEHIYHTHSKFRWCSQCGHYYWPGTHWQKIKEIVASLRVKNKQ